MQMETETETATTTGNLTTTTTITASRRKDRRTLDPKELRPVHSLKVRRQVASQPVQLLSLKDRPTAELPSARSPKDPTMAREQELLAVKDRPLLETTDKDQVLLGQETTAKDRIPAATTRDPVLDLPVKDLVPALEVITKDLVLDRLVKDLVPALEVITKDLVQDRLVKDLVPALEVTTKDPVLDHSVKDLVPALEATTKDPVPALEVTTKDLVPEQVATTKDPVPVPDLETTDLLLLPLPRLLLQLLLPDRPTPTAKDRDPAALADTAPNHPPYPHRQATTCRRPGRYATSKEVTARRLPPPHHPFHLIRPTMPWVPIKIQQKPAYSASRMPNRPLDG